MLTVRKAVGMLAGWLLVALPVAGAPVTFPFLTGNLTMTLSAEGGGSFLAPPATQSLDGSQVTADTMAGTLPSFELTSAGPFSFSLTPNSLDSIDEIVISDVMISGNGGAGSLSSVGGTEFFGNVAPVSVSYMIAVKGGASASPTDGFPSASGTVFTDGNTLGWTGIAVSDVDPLDGSPFELKLDFDFQGERASAPAVPEPGAALVFVFGFAAMASAIRRAR